MSTSNEILSEMAKQLGINEDDEVSPLVLNKENMEVVCRMILAFKAMAAASGGATAPVKRGPGRPRKVA